MWSPPAASAVAVRPAPMSTGPPGVSSSPMVSVLPYPSWPTAPLPQQRTLASSSTAQVCRSPASIRLAATRAVPSGAAACSAMAVPLSTPSPPAISVPTAMMATTHRIVRRVTASSDLVPGRAPVLRDERPARRPVQESPRAASRVHPHERVVLAETVDRRSGGHDLAVGLDGDVVGGIEAAEEVDGEQAASSEGPVEGAVVEVAGHG